MKPPVRVAVTGAAGQISYALLFRIASGDMLGHDQPVILQLLEIPPAMEALQGTVMEIEDAAFPLVQGIVASDEPEVAFGDADFAMLVGARPRGPGMERKDLLTENARIFSVQGAAINAVASRDIRVLVVGNPANTSCLELTLGGFSFKSTSRTVIGIAGAPCPGPLDHERTSYVAQAEDHHLQHPHRPNRA